METKTHQEISITNGVMYGRNKKTYCWEEMKYILTADEYDKMLNKIKNTEGSK